MKKLMLIAALSVTALHAQADVIGVQFGVDRWQSELSGSSTSDSPGLQTDNISSSSKGNSLIWAKLEHPIPVLPNLRVSQTNLENKYQNGAGSKNTLDASHADLIAYYEVLDSIIELDIGLGAKKFSGKLESPLNINQIELDSTVAVAYLMLAAELPITNLQIGAELQAGQGSDETVNDASLFLRYKTSIGVGFGAGYRFMQAELEGKDGGTSVTTDTDHEGFFLSLLFQI